MSDYLSDQIQEIQNTFSAVRKSENQLSKDGQVVTFIKAESQQNEKIKEGLIIHEDFLRSKPDLVISRISSVLGYNEKRIFARKTKTVELTKKEARSFVAQYHLIGFGGGHNYFGLLYQNELVAVAIFSKILEMKYENPPYDSVELERFCTIKNTTVVGGLDKLIKSYLKKNKVDDIVTYIDKEWSRGRSFLNLGFELVEKTPPLTFEVNKASWKRRLVKNPKNHNAKPNTYLVRNQGNLKLRLKTD